MTTGVKLFLPIQSAIACAEAIAGVHHMWPLAANDSDKKGLMVWNTQTKLHYLHHPVEKAMFLNPRRGNTMMEETYMGGVQDSGTLLFELNR